MRNAAWLWLACLVLAAPVDAQRDPETGFDAAHRSAVSSFVKRELPALIKTYRHLHQNPELSLQEEQTAAYVAQQLGDAGFQVTRGVGGHGVVGLLSNGKGPTVMIRGDMDGLPVTEKTGLPFASRKRVTREDGGEVGVMHACGHDVHVTNLLGTARLLASHRTLWAGTLMIVAQPAEELGRGALAMMSDGLFKRFAKPDYTLALHVDSGVEAGKVAIVSGWAAANVDAVEITVFGRGGHGARPHQANDPVVTAAYLVTSLQTLVSRRVDPQAAAVVTVGSFHAGHKGNVIPDSAKLQLTVRSYSDAVRNVLIDGIRQLAADVCKAHRCPKPPKVSIREAYTPAVYNDPGLAARAGAVFRAALGEQALGAVAPTMGGEDFGRYSRALKVPGLLFRLGAVAPRDMKRSRRKGSPLPSLHSSRFAPDAERALRTGVQAMGHLALALFAPPAVK